MRRDDFGLDSALSKVFEDAEHGVDHAIGLGQERFGDDRNLHAFSVDKPLPDSATVGLRVSKRQVNTRS